MPKPLQDATDDELSQLATLHCQLSPENLCADGELPKRVWMASYRKLSKELSTFARAHDLSEAAQDEAAVFTELSARAKRKNHEPKTPRL